MKGQTSLSLTFTPDLGVVVGVVTVRVVVVDFSDPNPNIFKMVEAKSLSVAEAKASWADLGRAFLLAMIHSLSWSVVAGATEAGG